MTKIYFTDYALSEGGHTYDAKKAHLELFAGMGICTCVFTKNYCHTLTLPCSNHLITAFHPLNFSDAKCISLSRMLTGMVNA